MTHFAEMQLLAYMNGSLTAEEYQKVDSHLQHCEQCRTQLAFLQELKVHMQEHYLVQAPPAYLWDQISRQIEAEPKQDKKIIPLHNGRQRASVREKPIWGWVGATAAAVLFTVQAILIHGSSIHKDAVHAYAPLGAQQTQRLHIWVRFSPQANTQAIARFLQQHRLKIDDGPDSQGRFRIALPDGSNEQALQQALRQLSHSHLVDKIWLP